MAKRVEKAKATRLAILQAASVTVGRLGYGGASIARIAEEAGVSAGLIYHYFETQQDLFDQILPELGEKMLRAIAEAVDGIEDPVAREAAAFEANLAYLDENPEMQRVMAEAVYFAPTSHRAFLERITRSYSSALVQARGQGILQHFQEDELEALSLIFIGAREFLLERYSITEEGRVPLPPEIRQTYLKAIGLILAKA